MTPSVATIRELLSLREFDTLFVEELGWDRSSSTALRLAPGDGSYDLTVVAQKRGAVVCSLNQVPNRATRMRIERELSKVHFEHVIAYVDEEDGLQVWQWARREPGRPVAHREYWLRPGQSGEVLAERLAGLTFSLEEEPELTLTAVTSRLRRSFDADRVTRSFYDTFKLEQEQFVGFISGIAESSDREWYGSLMLNRLMFSYFIQKKGFLDGDVDYLRTRLRHLEGDRQSGAFLTFYRLFLRRLFHEGLGSQQRSSELDSLLGNIPYLNGGLFEVHVLEADYPGIDIPDEAFARIFDFFDQYRWHLDERPLQSDKEINPDVLGFIFEKFVNQKEMGAYYTKEDITGFIAESTVIPAVFALAGPRCAIAFDRSAALWRMLRDNPARYLRGYGSPERSEDARAAEPPPLLEHGFTDSSDALARLARGDVTTIGAAVDLNLALPQLAQDAIQYAEGPELVRAFYKALNELTVLDPTCGSGAFLFAVLKVLQPLYEACFEKMRAFLAEAEVLGQAERRPFEDFRQILGELDHHPNESTFVLKSIVVNNLFGVDIMAEAVEICKLRLFLKLVGQAEPSKTLPNSGLEALPDIDFNIRTGNAVVGFATLDEVRAAIGGPKGGQTEVAFDDTLAEVEHAARQIDEAFRAFRHGQLTGDTVGGHALKEQITLQLDTVRQRLNGYLASDHDSHPSRGGDALDRWVKDNQPFHWFVEFYETLRSGGFDVIVGNPPYVEVPRNYSRRLLRKTFETALDKWSRDEDLCILVIERSLTLAARDTGSFGMILPLSVAFSTKTSFVRLRSVLEHDAGTWHFAHFDRIPSALFGNDVRTRCTIAIVHRGAPRDGASTTPLLRWEAEQRPLLFPKLRFAKLRGAFAAGIPKVGSQVQADTLERLLRLPNRLGEDLTAGVPFTELQRLAPNFPQPCVYVGGTAYNWFPAWRDVPETSNADGLPSLPARTAGYRFASEAAANAAFAVLCSSMGYWWWAVASDGFNLKKWLLDSFPLGLGAITPGGRTALGELGAVLRQELQEHYVFKLNKGRIGNYFLPACGDLVKAIDDALAADVEALTPEFFADIRMFNLKFARVSVELD